jgi:ankyrin repeat protein
LRGELRTEHYLLMQVPAERGDTPVLETMLLCGFDPNVADHDGVTPLHRAAMGGRADAVRALIAGGANVNALDGMFSGTPLLWAAEGGSYSGDRQSDYLSVARQLIAAGSPREWVPPENAPRAENALEKLADLVRAASA